MFHTFGRLLSPCSTKAEPISTSMESKEGSYLGRPSCAAREESGPEFVELGDGGRPN